MNEWKNVNSSLIEMVGQDGARIATVAQFLGHEWRGCYEPTMQRFKAPTAEQCIAMVEACLN